MQTTSDRTVARLEREVTRLEDAQRDLMRRLDKLESEQFGMRLSRDTQETFLQMTFLLAMAALVVGLRG